MLFICVSTSCSHELERGVLKTNMLHVPDETCDNMMTNNWCASIYYPRTAQHTKSKSCVPWIRFWGSDCTTDIQKRKAEASIPTAAEHTLSCSRRRDLAVSRCGLSSMSAFCIVVSVCT